MRKCILLCSFVIAFSFSSSAQTTTVFGGYKWYDLVKYPNMDKDYKSRSEVMVSSDSITVRLNNTVFRYLIKTINEVPKDFATDYTVERDGKPELIRIKKSFGDAAISDNYKTWLVISKRENITPLGYQFPGEPRINLEAEALKLVGYYKFTTMLFSSKIDINKDGIASTSYAEELNACQQNIQIEFLPDNTGTWWEGQTASDCKKSETKFKWKLVDTVIKAEHVLVLALKIDEIETNTYRVKELTKGGLDIIGEFNFGTGDTTVEADLYLWKMKKKK